MKKAVIDYVMKTITGYRLSTGSYERKTFKRIHLFNDDEQIGIIVFLPEEILGENYEERSGRIILYMNHSQFSESVDILRNEKPVHIHFYRNTNIGIISTTMEPVGEGE